MYKKIIVIGLFLFVSFIAIAQPKISADLDAAEYHPGDLVKVRLQLKDNPGLHNIFFFLEYDGHVLAFESLREGSFCYYENQGELLYADNSSTSGFATSRTVVSFSLNEPGLETSENGLIAELFFRITDQDSSSHNFRFSGGEVWDKVKNQIPNVVWNDSDNFLITSPYAGEFIKISRPYTNEVLYTPFAEVSLICSQGNYLVKLLNSTNNFDSGFIPVSSGCLYSMNGINTKVNIVNGMNTIIAELYAPDPNGGNNHLYLTNHSVRVYQSTGSRYISITNPQNHELLNSDSVTVRVDSSLEQVFINGEPAVYQNGEYIRRIQLKNGFNTITATGRKNNILYERSISYILASTSLHDATASWQENTYSGMYLEIGGYFASITSNTRSELFLTDNEIPGRLWGQSYRIRSSRELDDEILDVIFKDSVSVFYQKDSGMFRFLKPEENQGFKPGEYSTMDIFGEIDSFYRPLADPFSQVYEKNSVTLQVTYFPYNPLEQTRELFAGPACIQETEAGSIAQSPYVFYLGEGVSLKGLSDGEIEIVAYKNKQGNFWDDKITRYVYVDNQRLWINLVQPNVYTSDVLDSREKIERFNGPNSGEITVTSVSLTIADEGSIGLSPVDSVIELQNIQNIKAMAEAPDGSLYALVNESSSILAIYKKELKDPEWRLLISRTGLYGYTLQYTSIGLLLGASNIPANGNSGLYLVNGDKLINITFQNSTPFHVQFIKNHNGRIYLYGSLYKNLYSFSLKSLKENGGRLVADSYESIPFANTYNILDFILTKNADSLL
jgi:hypothetical protein